MNDLFRAITAVLERHGVKCEASERSLSVTDRVVTDLCHPDQQFSNAVVEAIWPRLTDIEVYHYTRGEAARTILGSRTWRLYALSKRFDEGEIISFSKAHDLDGYLHEDENGDPLYKSLNMANMFYASFTKIDVPADIEDYFWQVFAAPRGVRFRLRLTARNPNLRAIYYPGVGHEPIPLLRDLQAAARRFGREFILSGISRVCAFYLHSNLRVENEVRMLYRKWDGYGPSVETDGRHQFIPVPLSADSPTGFAVTVLEVQTTDADAFHDYGVTVVRRA